MHGPFVPMRTVLVETCLMGAEWVPGFWRHTGLAWDREGSGNCVCAGQRHVLGSAGPGWDELFGAHNPEVAGSNPAPATEWDGTTPSGT